MATTNRLADVAPSTNGKAKAKRQRAPKPVTGADAKQAAKEVVRWAKRYTGGAVLLSSGLNAWASVQDSGAAAPLSMAAAAVVGGVVPVGVWVLSKLGGHLVRAKWHRLAGSAGGVGVFLLALSLCHCSAAIGGLTGASWLLSVLLAVGIDCGLVVSELASVLVQEAE